MLLHVPFLSTDLTSSFNLFADHLKTNTIGPIITAQKLLDTRIPIRSIVFMSSDSGSMTDFRHFEDGFVTTGHFHVVLDPAY